MTPRVFWSLALAVLGAGLLFAAWCLYVPPPLPPMPPKVKERETKARPPDPAAATTRPDVAPPPADPLLRRWQTSVRQRDEKGVLSAQSEFLRREEEYREPLSAMAKEDSEPRIRAFCVAVLGRMKSPPPEDFFVGRLGDAHEYPRTSALQALEKLGTAHCLAEVDRLASSDPAEGVRTAAAQAAKVVRSR